MFRLAEILAVRNIGACRLDNHKLQNLMDTSVTWTTERNAGDTFPIVGLP